MNQSRLSIILSILPVITAGLFLLGLAYHEGYLEMFGLDDSLFPVSKDRILVFGFLSLVSISTPSLFYTITALMILLSAVVISGVIFSGSPLLARMTKRLSLDKKSEQKNEEVLSEYERFKRLLATTLGYLGMSGILILFFIVIVFLSLNSGRQQALSEIKAFSMSQENYVTLHSALLERPERVKQLVCSSSHCAFWTGSSTVVLRHEQIQKIVASRPSLP
ncbi:MAG: hypothetical protein RLZZ271_1037 [Pseudomonadota bacterium]|jgi:ribosomal protein L31